MCAEMGREQGWGWLGWRAVDGISSESGRSVKPRNNFGLCCVARWVTG
jgi:hypothetical protein